MSSTLHGRIRHGSGVRVLPNLMPGEETLGLDATMGRARMLGPLILVLSGIAEGYGVDRLARGECTFGITGALAAIDREVRATGLQPDGAP